MTEMPDAAALRAKKILFGLFVGWMVIDAFLVALSAEIPRVGRLLLTLLLMYYVLQGRLWARNLMIGLFGLGVIWCVGFGIWNFQEMPTVAIVMFAFAALISVIPTYLILSKDLRRYLDWKCNNAPLKPAISPAGWLGLSPRSPGRGIDDCATDTQPPPKIPIP